jgi:anti-sigma regulatory factor (Ser/Thr protein kinase)
MAVAAFSGDNFRHLAFFYRGRDEYLAGLRSFIQASRERGAAVLAAVPLRQAQLTPQEVGADSAQVTLVDMAELGRNPARIIPALLAYAGNHRGQHIYCIDEPIWPGRTTAEMQEAVKHEALINLAFRDNPVTVLCPYDTAGLPGSVIADAERTHPVVIKGRQGAASAGYLEPPSLPPRCNRALPHPPAHAETLSYCDDLRSVRSFVTSRAVRAGLAPSRVSDLVLAISELAGNSLCHTDGGGTVQIWQTEDQIICQLSDTGQLTDPLAGYRAQADGLLGGNRLWLVNQVSDLVQARTGPSATTVRLHMRLRLPSPPSQLSEYRDAAQSRRASAAT